MQTKQSLLKRKDYKMTDKAENLNVEELSVESTDTESQYQEVVEIPWEEAEQLVRLRAALAESEQYTSSFLLTVEKRKASLLSRMAEIESALYEQANAIRDTKNLNPDWSFELKLPAEQGEKGYFIRKEE